MTNRIALSTLAVTILAIGCTDHPAEPEGTIARPQMDGLSSYIGYYTGPTNLTHQGPWTWQAKVSDHPACVSWYHRNSGETNWTLVQDGEIVEKDGFSTYTASFPDQYTPDFELQAIPYDYHYPSCSSAALGSFSQISVTVTRPLYPQLQLGTINGPEFIYNDGDYSWSVTGTSGGDGSYSYSWYLTYSNNPQVRTLVSNNSSYSLNVSGCDGDFRLEVTVTSAGQLSAEELYVMNMAPDSHCF